jgi:hypothetical protein
MEALLSHKLINISRRLSSGLGLAAGADERQLRTELPRHAVGFQSPIALAINVRIARVTDEIMSSELLTLPYILIMAIF